MANDRLRVAIEVAREKETADLWPFCDDAKLSNSGRWTAKDVLAHLMMWRVHGAAELAAIRSGAPGPAISQNVDEENENIYRATRDLPAKTVLDQARRSWDRFAAEVAAFSEEALHRPRLRRPEQAAWELVTANTAHVGLHLGYWHTERGDEVAAENAATWAHDLAIEAFDDERQLGNAAYDLGCFYARRGRIGDALPHLRRAVQLNPGLSEWARQDTDLDPIRTAPELVDLLG